jgi:hypothetical protein
VFLCNLPVCRVEKGVRWEGCGQATGHCKQQRMSPARWLESSVATELVLDDHTRCFLVVLGSTRCDVVVSRCKTFCVGGDDTTVLYVRLEVVGADWGMLLARACDTQSVLMHCTTVAICRKRDTFTLALSA